MAISCTVTGLEQLVNLNREQIGSRTSLNVEGKDFHIPDHQIEQTLEQAMQHVVDRVMDCVNTQVKCLESLMSKQSLEGGYNPNILVPVIIREWVLKNFNLISPLWLIFQDQHLTIRLQNSVQVGPA